MASDRRTSTPWNAQEPRPKEILEACLARIGQSNEVLRAVIALDREPAARAAAESATRWRDRAPLSPIDGMPVLVKANIAVAGLPWHAGIAAYRDRIAHEDAPAVARLRAAGAVILGLTNMDEGALGAAGHNPWLGRIGNPRDPGASSGGSSGGSAAAVAAGYCLAALGTDTIGSIAIPASYCGVVGHRASRDLLSLDDIVPLSPTFDRAGWHVRSAADALTIGQALGLVSSNASPGIAALAIDTLDVPQGITAAMDTGIEAARQCGWTIDRIVLPGAFDGLARRMFEVAEADAAVIHHQMLKDRPHDFSPAFRRMLGWGAEGGARRRKANLADLGQVAGAIRERMAGYDALLMPAVPHAGFAVGSPPPVDQAMFAALPACLGWPATTIPVGSDGLALLITSASDDMCLTIANRIAAECSA